MEKLWMAWGGHKQYDQCLLFDGLNLALPYTPSHKPGLSVSFIKIFDRSDIAAAGKRAFRAAQEAWNHLVRVGITQMNKLWVGILILRKHLSLQKRRERKPLLLTHSLFQSPSSLLQHTSTLFPRLHLFLHLWLLFSPFCSHLIRPGNMLSCFSKHWVYHIFLPCHQNGMRINLEDLFNIMITLSSVVRAGIIIHQDSKSAVSRFSSQTQMLKVSQVLCV